MIGRLTDDTTSRKQADGSRQLKEQDYKLYLVIIFTAGVFA